VELVLKVGENDKPRHSYLAWHPFLRAVGDPAHLVAVNEGNRVLPAKLELKAKANERA
jgi:hypothetical protein